MNGKRISIPQVRRCELEDWEVPQELAEGQALVAIEASLVSPGTELAIYAGRHTNLSDPHAAWKMPFPFRPGYCAVARVLRCGAGVTEVVPGDRVFGLLPHASHWVGPATELQPVPDEISATDATFVHLCAISLNGVRVAAPQLGESAIVTGLGMIGLFALRFAHLSGTFPLIGTDPDANRRNLALRLGADAALDPTAPDFPERIKELTGARMADVVIEASGNPRVIAQAAQMTRPGGRLVLLGSPHGKIEFDFYSLVHARSVRMLGAHIGAAFHPETQQDAWNVRRNRECVFAMMRRGELDLKPFTSAIRRPEEFPQIYEEALAPGHSALGVLVDWSKSAQPSAQARATASASA